MDRVSLVKLPASLVLPGERTDARFVMGIDGGATKTLAAVYDLQAGGYVFAFAFNTERDPFKLSAPHSAHDFAPETLATEGVR